MSDVEDPSSRAASSPALLGSRSISTSSGTFHLLPSPSLDQDSRSSLVSSAESIAMHGATGYIYQRRKSKSEVLTLSRAPLPGLPTLTPSSPLTPSSLSPPSPLLCSARKYLLPPPPCRPLPSPPWPPTPPNHRCPWNPPGPHPTASPQPTPCTATAAASATK